MKKLLFTLLICPLLSIAQKTVPRLENDTVYTTSGYKIYKGQVLQFANGTAENGNFRFVKIRHNGGIFTTSRIENARILVRKLSHYEISGLGNHYVRIDGALIHKVGSKEKIELTINFDRAINNFTGLPGELIVPDEFKNNQTGSGVADELIKLNKLYKEGIITKEEFEALKKKLIEKQ